ncbi:helix-turn-helix domain-containing protein [Ammonicoccus fulvus]|uniref:Helix-turn-helix domain-containing protein n=1 Tax=Ammonicoccus fulvus TaxID=3138240 RepID=A0ABZ3FMH8_9ACTN
MGLEHLRHLARPGRVLDPHRNAGHWSSGRDGVGGELGSLVSHLWWVRWDAPEGFTQRVLSDPVIHLTIEEGSGPVHGFETPALLVHGVVPKVFEVALPATGRVTGVAFQAGALPAALGLDATDLTGRVVPAEDVFGDKIKELVDVLVSEPAESIRRELLAAWLIQRINTDFLRDRTFHVVRNASDLVDRGDFVRVDDLAAAVHVSARTLQRAYGRLVGVSPLWAIRRRRLQRVAERMDRGEAEDLAALAAELGFADQAHLSREFRNVIGRSPSAYRGSS